MVLLLYLLISSFVSEIEEALPSTHILVLYSLLSSAVLRMQSWSGPHLPTCELPLIGLRRLLFPLTSATSALAHV